MRKKTAAIGERTEIIGNRSTRDKLLCYFKGLCLKGGAEATAEWTNAVINKASLKATVDQVLKVKVPQGKKYRVLLNSKEAIANPDAKGLITVEMKRGDLLELL